MIRGITPGGESYAPSMRRLVKCEEVNDFTAIFVYEENPLFGHDRFLYIIQARTPKGVLHRSDDHLGFYDADHALGEAKRLLKIWPVTQPKDEEPEPKPQPLKYPDLPNWHLHICFRTHEWFEIPYVNPECFHSEIFKRLVRPVECPQRERLTEHFMPFRYAPSELHSPFDAERAKATTA